MAEIALVYVFVFLVGLCIGSFINVVAYRGPAMWGLSDESRESRGTLLAPPSRCPTCKAPIQTLALVPVVSYFALLGKCGSCGARIPARYPLTELAGGLALVGSVVAYGFSLEAVFAATFILFLLALAVIDAETGYLPDALTLPLLWIGLLANIGGRFVTLEDAVIGAAAGYAAFRLIALAYQQLRRREGLGRGDAKLLAAIGAWAGWQALAPAVFLGAVLTLSFVAAAMLMRRKITAATPISFGPGLCFGGAAALLAAAWANPLAAGIGN